MAHRKVWYMKREIPPAVIVVALIVVVAVIGIIGYKTLSGGGKVQMSAQAIQGMKEHMAGQGQGQGQSPAGGFPGPGAMSQMSHSR
jgi:hypothetical protein